MRKGIVLLIVALIYGCGVFARPDSKVPATDTSCPTVTLTQEQFDSLVSAASKSNQMELIAKEESNQMYEKYTTLVTIIIAVMGVLVAVVGVVVPILMNNDTKKKIEKHEEAIKASERTLSDYNTKFEEFEKRLNAIKEDAEETARDAKAHALFAWARQKEGNRSIELYTRAIDEKKDFWEAYYNRGLKYREIGDYAQAIKDFDKTIELKPDNARAYRNRGIAYRKKGDYDRAIKDYDKAIELNPLYAEAYINRGRAYRMKGDYDHAIKDYDMAIELNPQYARAYNNLGYAYLGKNNFPAALDAVNKAIAIAPSSSSYLDSRADVWIAWGKYKKEHPEEYPDIDWKDNLRNASSDVEKAFSLNPSEKLKKKLEDKCAECKQLLEE